MHQDFTYNSNYSTLALLVMKDLRFERNVHQGALAHAAGKSPSAWTKIESGQSTFTFDSLMGACSAFQLWPSYILTITERLSGLFNERGYYFHPGTLHTEEDDLLPLVLSYYNSRGFERLKNRPEELVYASMVNNPFNAGATPTIVSYCTDRRYRDWIDDGARGSPQPRLRLDFDNLL